MTDTGDEFDNDFGEAEIERDVDFDAEFAHVDRASRSRHRREKLRRANDIAGDLDQLLDAVDEVIEQALIDDAVDLGRTRVDPQTRTWVLEQLRERFERRTTNEQDPGNEFE